MSEWEDRKNKKMKIRMTMGDQMMHHLASWNMKHILIIICNTAGEEFMTPYIGTSQDSEPFRKKLMHHGVRMGIDFVLWQWLKQYLKSSFFLKCINNIFVPYLNKHNRRKSSKHAKHAKQCFWWTNAQVMYQILLSRLSLVSE
jgi:hypothetical protein